MTELPFRNRAEAAHELARALADYADEHPLVLAIPRGGVPMGRILADALGGELDIVLVRKLGAPGNPELAIGAIDERGHATLNDYAMWVGATDAYVTREAEQQGAALRRRRTRYSGSRPPAEATGRTVIVVDDGLATGSTMAAALRAVRAQHPKRLVCAVPVGSSDGLRDVGELADDVVCLATPHPFHYVGLYYDAFPPVGDDEVVRALAGTVHEGQARTVDIPARGVTLRGDLVLPGAPRGLVLFAHGSGSSRLSPRNRFVAGVLQRAGIGTLLFDLLTRDEDIDVSSRFDIALMSTRLEAALDWAVRRPELHGLRIGLFGASTGSAAALIVASQHPEDVSAVVSRGGRPDLAGADALAQVHVPTLLIVGAADTRVLDLNWMALRQMHGWARIETVAGAGHLFEEPGTLAEAASHACDWFVRHLATPAAHVAAGASRPHAGSGTSQSPRAH